MGAFYNTIIPTYPMLSGRVASGVTGAQLTSFYPTPELRSVNTFVRAGRGRPVVRAGRGRPENFVLTQPTALAGPSFEVVEVDFS